MTSDPVALTALAAWCFAVALAGGLAGLVLGNIRLPAVLAAASNPAAGAGANIGISGIAAAAASIAHIRAGRVNWRLFGWMAPPSMAGAVAGGYAAGAIPDEILLGVIGTTLLYFGVDLLRPSRAPKPKPREELDIRAAVVSGALIGVLGGLVGLILGTLRMPALLRNVGETAHRAVGTNLTVGVCVGVAGVIGHAPEGVDWSLLALGGAASIPGAVIGARLTGRLSTQQLLRAIGGLLVVAGVGILISGASAAAASPPSAGAATAQERQGSLELAGTIARPWPDRQNAEGSFPDYMAPRGSASRDLYGHAMLGYGLLKTGFQRKDQRAIDAGMRGLVYAVDHPRTFHSIVFEKLALAAGYNLARARSPTNPLFISARARWEDRLRVMRPTWLGRRRTPYFNQHLVDAVTLIELARSGLRPLASGGVGHAAELVNDRLPRLLLARTVAGRTLASDGALSYQALTLGFYARAVQLLGSRAGPRAQALLGRLARASFALSGPDGDVAYFGRSQEQAWSLALTSYGAEVAAERAGRGRAGRLRALSLRAMQRLRSVHAGGPNGLYLTPAFRSDPLAAIESQESYVSGTAYTGLTLLGLGWASDRIGAARARPGRVAAGGNSAFALDRGARRFTVRSTGRAWMAVRPFGSGIELLALKVRDGDRWHDVLPHGARESNSGLPAARLESRRRAAPRVSLTPCGVRIEAPPAGRRWGLTLFLPTRSLPRRTGKREVADRATVVRYRGAGHIVFGGPGLSPSFGPLVRAHLSVRGRAGFSIGLTGCRR